jgi:hypothetical protein
VPLKLNATLSDDNLAPIAKTGRDTILAQIVTDLKLAESKALATYGDPAFDKGRITKYSINAILADVYLWMDKYDESIAECNKIINSQKFGLIRGATVTGPVIDYNSDWFNTLYYNGNSNEGIFELQFDAQALNPYFNMFSSSAARRWTATADLMDRVFTVDFTNDQNYDIRADGASVRAATSTIWKYVGANATVLRTFDQSYAHWFFYRYADILLMKAEALNEKGSSGAEALSLIYSVRQRANALAATDLAPSPTDKVLIQDFILQERAREFCFEGKRWYDVLRNAKRNNYQRISLLLNMVATSVPSNLQQAAQAKMQDHNSHYFPIYLYELQTNKLLVQNPFYR